MKKIIFLFAAYLTTTLAFAQTITSQAIAGNWKMCAFDINGIHWDFKSDAVTLPAEYEGTLGKNQKEAMIADVKEGLADYKNGTIMIKGNYIEQSMGADVGSGTYTIEKKDGRNYLKIVNDDKAKTTDLLQVALKNGQMHLIIPDEIGGTSTLIYCK